MKTQRPSGALRAAATALLVASSRLAVAFTSPATTTAPTTTSGASTAAGGLAPAASAVVGVPRGGAALSLRPPSRPSDGDGDNGGGDNDIESDGNGNRRRRLLLGALGSVAALPVAAEAYSRRAYDLRSGRGVKSGKDLLPPERGWDGVEHATVVFHGAGGQDSYTDELMDALRKRGKNDGSTYDIMIDWSDDSSNLLQASFNGQRVGRRVGSTLLARAPNLKTIHAVGISVGAFAADACVTEMKDQIAAAARRRVDADGVDDRGDVYAQLTLLDPFLQRGAIDPSYGQKNFGRSADYAQQFYNTDDPVPATGKPCPNCVCTDLTPIRPESIFGHDWPLVHYARSGRVGLVSERERSPAGSIFVATTN